MISIIGVGTGADMLTDKGVKSIKEADVIIGAKRLITTYKSYWDNTDKQLFEEYDAEKIKKIVDELEERNAAILVSGDTGFYSAAETLVNTFADCEVIPGVSSVNSFFAKLKIPWQDATLVSVHGRKINLVDIIRRNKKTFALTGNNIGEIASSLIEADFGNLEVFVGSNLDSSEEFIEHTRASELMTKQYEKLSVLLFINDNYDSSVRTGIPDEEFIRGDVPMTKSEIRANIISMLEIKPDDVCFDIGAGTGSVTVEMALSAWNGNVVAIEKKEEGVQLIKNNLRSFHIGNAEVIHGDALEVLDHVAEYNLPKPDVCFIGGSDGELSKILPLLFSMNPEIRIVISAIALETLQTAMNCFKELKKEFEVVQISVSKNKSISGLNLMMANNPIYLIKGL